jgi:hypothetical protein
MFVGNIFVKLLRDFTCRTRGLKGLFYTLNAIVHPTKEGFIFLFFLFFIYFQFCIAKGLAICKFRGVISTYFSTLIYIC